MVVCVAQDVEGFSELVTGDFGAVGVEPGEDGPVEDAATVSLPAWYMLWGSSSSVRAVAKTCRPASSWWAVCCSWRRMRARSSGMALDLVSEHVFGPVFLDGQLSARSPLASCAVSEARSSSLSPWWLARAASAASRTCWRSSAGSHAVVV